MMSFAVGMSVTIVHPYLNDGRVTKICSRFDYDTPAANDDNSPLACTVAGQPMSSKAGVREVVQRPGGLHSVDRIRVTAPCVGTPCSNGQRFTLIAAEEP